MKILVIGAGGFVGRAIVASAVARFGADRVIAGVRRTPARADALAMVEQRILDATDLASVRSACAGVSTVVSSVMGSDALIVEAARVQAMLLAAGDIDRLVHLSSVAVYGVREGLVRKSDAPGIPADGYARAKIEAERIIRAGQSGRHAILRPALVYGPGSYLWTDRIAALLRQGRLGDMGPAGEGYANLVHVRDVADAVAAACQADDALGNAFNLAMPDPPTWNRYLTDFARALGLQPRTVPGWRLRGERLLAYPLKAAQALGGRLGLATPEAITPGLARLFAQKVRFDVGAARALLPGWTDYRAGLAECAAGMSG